MTPRQVAELFFALQRSNERLAECGLRVLRDLLERSVFRDAAAFQDGQRIAEATDLDRIVCHQDDGEAEL